MNLKNYILLLGFSIAHFTMMAQAINVSSSSSYENSGWGEAYAIDGQALEVTGAKGW